MYRKRTMRKSWLLLVLLLIVFVYLLWRSRERFNPAMERPEQSDTSLQRTIRAITGTTSDTIVNAYISSIQKFYDTKYVRGSTPNSETVTSFVNGEDLEFGMTKEGLRQVIDYVFLSTETPPPTTENGDSTETTTGTTAGTTEGTAGGTTGGTTTGGATAGATISQSMIGNYVFGPAFVGLGEVPPGDTGDSSRTTQYPELLGGQVKSSAFVEGVGVVSPSQSLEGLPTPEGTGSAPGSQFFPTSRVPGDMDMIPDPYRVSQTFSTSTYSSKTEPVPFLTDFSAFLK